MLTIDTILEILGLCIGLLYLWWEYHADSKVWLASVVMPAISMWIYYSKGLYADFGINIYYLLIAVYGFISWTKKTPSHNSGESTEKGSVRQITRTPVSTGVFLIFVAAMLWWGLWWLLVTFTDSTVPGRRCLYHGVVDSGTLDDGTKVCRAMAGMVRRRHRMLRIVSL